ncbi:MAG: hypothetical protein LBG20_02970 [Holosporaceae bacterium]|nr:hypothetical protein [Holosporaceae bacterium]
MCTANDVTIVSGGLSQEHVHLLLSILPSISVSKNTPLRGQF